MTNSQKIEWICQCSALPVFLTLVEASMIKKGMYLVSSSNLQGWIHSNWILTAVQVFPEHLCSDFQTFYSQLLRNASVKFHPVSISGWGDTGVQETSTDKLQETTLFIVPTSNCIERMDNTEGVDENLIVCGGGAAEGPCKVGHPKLSSVLKFNLGWQWWATYSCEWGR